MPRIEDDAAGKPVFLSYSASDRALASRLLSDLRNSGFTASSLRDVIPAGASTPPDRLDPRIVSAIRGEGYFVPLLSPASVKSRWVVREIEIALQAEVERAQAGVIPALIGQCTIPDSLALRGRADFTSSYKEGLRALVAGLSAPPLDSASATPPSDATNQVVANTMELLRAYLSSHPDALYRLSPRSLEEFVAELLADQGFEVELTTQSRDGGVDIIAFGGHDKDCRSVLIQCKRYSPARKVGVEAVESLYGAMVSHGSGRAMLVTTSSFTAAAKDSVWRSLSRDRWEVDLVDFKRLLVWLSNASGFGAQVTTLIRQIRQRHGELVDRKFAGEQTTAETEELARLETLLDEVEGPTYAALKDTLLRERNRLRSAHNPEGDAN